jgi:tetratricopeptide (TPR) repeat protein
MAKLYLAAAGAELGDPAEAISILKKLKDPEEMQQFKLDACVQLARAYAKKHEYEEAEKQLVEAEIEAKKGGNRKLSLIVAYRAFFVALRGASTPLSNEAICLAKKAIELAEEVIKLAKKAAKPPTDAPTSAEKIYQDDEIGLATRFEAAIASGTAHMWLGKLYSSEAGKHSEWEQAKQQFLSARELQSNSTRVLYNMGILYMLRGDDDKAKGREWYEKAKGLIARSLELNPFDQLADHTMASPQQQNWGREEGTGARQAVGSGRVAGEVSHQTHHSRGSL